MGNTLLTIMYYYKRMNSTRAPSSRSLHVLVVHNSQKSISHIKRPALFSCDGWFRASKRSVPEKRMRGSPTGNTPQQKEKRPAGDREKSSRSRKHLTFDCSTGTWSDLELGALVEFILLHRPGQRWPSDKDPRFWDSAGKYVSMRSESGVQRTGIKCNMHTMIIENLQN